MTISTMDEFLLILKKCYILYNDMINNAGMSNYTEEVVDLTSESSELGDVITELRGIFHHKDLLDSWNLAKAYQDVYDQLGSYHADSMISALKMYRDWLSSANVSVSVLDDIIFNIEYGIGYFS